MAKHIPWYVQQRAESLVVMFLTKEPGIQVTREEGLDFGLDFKLFLDPHRSDAWVAVQLKALDDDPPQKVSWERPGLGKAYFEKIEVPLFLLAVNAKDETYFFAWLKEPQFRQGPPKLVSHLKNERLQVKEIHYAEYHDYLADCRAYFRGAMRKTGTA